MSGRKNENKNKKENVETKEIISRLSLIISIFSLVVAFWSVHVSSVIAKTDRRVDTYTEAIVSLDTMYFYAWSFDNGEEIISSEIDEQWEKNQILDAVKIKAKLDIFDKEKADSYWKIVSQIFSHEHKFDIEEYEKLKSAIMNEI